MGMIINQEYMDEYVVGPLNRMQKQIDELEKKINLTVSNSGCIVREFDRVIKSMKIKKK